MPSCRRATHALENKTFVPRLAAGSVSAVLAAAGLPCWWQSTSGYFRELHAWWAAEPNWSLGAARSLVQLRLGWFPAGCWALLAARGWLVCKQPC